METIQTKAHPSNNIINPNNKDIINADTQSSFETNAMPGTVQRVFDIMSANPQATAKDIASQLDIQISTTKSYISQIYSQLGIHSRAEFNNLMAKIKNKIQ